MFKKRTLLLGVMVISLLLPSWAAWAGGPGDFKALIDAETVMAHIRALSVDIGARPMGSEAEASAAGYIAARFEEYGYDVEIQEFETRAYEGGDKGPLTSRNVIASRDGDEGIVVVGAHMDSVTNGTGAGDNASGVAVILAAAEALQDVEPVHTLVFVAFGSEENGDPMGSEYFVESLGDDVEDVIAMINIDSVGVGETLNVYAGAVVEWPDDEDAAPGIEGGPVWVRDLALSLADEMDLPFGTTPPESWDGYTGDWSDHYAFVLEDVPVAYFEAWQWEDVENPWWGQETPDGDVMHTEDDVYESVVPEKVEMTAELVAATAAAIATGEATGED